MIKIEHLCKSFGDTAVLKDISIEYSPGKCNMVIGASGSGKTVLLKTLIGLYEPDSNYDERKRLRQRIGMLFQASALFDFATVIENIMFPMDFCTGWTRAEKLDRARFCLDRVNVRDSDNKYPSELSGGMQKRVGIARAIALNPDYLFCDEPNSGLDPYTSSLIDDLISEITREYNMTTVINTHDMNSIRSIGDNIGFICDGRLLWQGDRHNIMETGCPELRKFLRI